MPAFNYICIDTVTLATTTDGTRCYAVKYHFDDDRNSLPRQQVYSLNFADSCGDIRAAFIANATAKGYLIA